MKNFNLKLIGDGFNNKILLITILLFIGYACEKEKNRMTEFEFQTMDITYYPEKQITMIFDIVPKGDLENYTVKWFNPDTLEDRGPYKIKFSTDIILDYEVLENGNTVQRFQYEIQPDTIDSLKYDYRNNYIGIYRCNVKYSFEDSTSYFQDTLTVVKNNTFSMLNILTPHDILNNYEGNKMTYLNSNGYNNYPTGDFYGYHAGVSFSNDSIHYSASGPLGFYYTNSYEGVKINNK